MASGDCLTGGAQALAETAGLIARGRKRGQHRKRRPRRPFSGMLLHIDGSEHRWFQDERWYDLLVILDDASSEIVTLSSFLVTDRTE
ncbi:MAG: hypothetical protein WB711_02450 [Terriglobales bacterium]